MPTELTRKRSSEENEDRWTSSPLVPKMVNGSSLMMAVIKGAIITRETCSNQ